MARMMYGDYAVFRKGVGKYGTCTSLKLPDLMWKTETVTGGGGMGEREFGMILNKLEMAFKFNSIEPDLMQDALPAPGSSTTWVVRGSVIVPGDDEKALKVTVTGAILDLKRDEFKPEKITNSDYAMKDIIYYQEVLDGQTLFEIDLLNQIMVGPDGIDRMERRRANIGR